MNFATAIFNSTPAARTVTIVLLAALTGITTDVFLKLAYGKPAPIAQASQTLDVNTNKSVPQWFAGGDAVQAASPSGIKLLGVVAQGNNGLQGYALIQTTGKRAQVLHVGQTLPDGTQLLRVQGKTVTLEIAGQQRTLTLESPANNGVATNNAPPMPQAYTGTQVDSATQQAQHMAHMAQIAQVQQLQQAATQVIQNAPEPGVSPAAEAAVSGQVRRRIGGRP